MKKWIFIAIGGVVLLYLWLRSKATAAQQAATPNLDSSTPYQNPISDVGNAIAPSASYLGSALNTLSSNPSAALSSIPGVGPGLANLLFPKGGQTIYAGGSLPAVQGGVGVNLGGLAQAGASVIKTLSDAVGLTGQNKNTTQGGGNDGTGDNTQEDEDGGFNGDNQSAAAASESNPDNTLDASPAVYGILAAQQQTDEQQQSLDQLEADASLNDAPPPSDLAPTVIGSPGPEAGETDLFAQPDDENFDPGDD